MKRPSLLLGLAVFVAANIAAGLFYRSHLQEKVAGAGRAATENPQARLKAQRAELEAWQRIASDYERRAGVTLADAIQLFDTAAVGWTEIALESSGEAGAPRLDVIAVRGLVGSVEQLTNVDKRLGSRCRSYQRSPTRDGAYLVSCQVKPGAFRRRD
jgi:hypothetical protein